MEVFKSGDIDISYYTKGSGEDVLLLHGFPDSSALWDKQVGVISYVLFIEFSLQE